MTMRKAYMTVPEEMRKAIETVCLTVRKEGRSIWDRFVLRRQPCRALLIGGCVRDFHFGVASKDFDIEVYGVKPNRLIKILSKKFELDLVGKDFGIVKIKDFPIDVSIPRRESKRGLGHKGFEVLTCPNMSVEEACLRRDFTMNAVSYDPLTDEVFDPVGGFADLDAKILRVVKNETFVEDPLRVLRAAQFLARFELTPSDGLVEVCRTIGIEGLPKERLLEEWKKLLLKGKKPSLGVKFLDSVGWLDYFPELAALKDVKQEEAWHPEGCVISHTLHCLDAFAEDRIGDEWEDTVVGFAVLCHDFGKPETTEFDEAEGRIRSKQHEVKGDAPTRSFLARLTNQANLVEEVVPLVMNHLAPPEFYRVKSSDAAIRRLAVRVRRLDRLVRVAVADQKGRPPLAADLAFVDWFKEKAERLHVKDSVPASLVMGRHLIDEFGLKPGPEFGKILSAAFEAQLDGQFSTLEGGLEFVRALLARNKGE